MTDILNDGILGGAGTIMSGIAGYFIRAHNRRIEKIEDEQEKLDKDLSNHKLDAERRYAKEDTLQNSLSRIHNRLDVTASKYDIDELRADIKTLFKGVPKHE